MTVVGSHGGQLGRGRTGHGGDFSIDVGPGTPHLLVVRWHGRPHVEYLGRTRSQVRDVELSGAAGRPRPAAPASTGPGIPVGTSRVPDRASANVDVTG